MRVPYAAFAPDQSPFSVNAAAWVENVIPTQDGYAPMSDFAAYATGELPDTCRGAKSFITDANAFRIFAGTTSGLYQYNGGSWVDLTPSGGYTAAEWNFTQFGSLVIAANGVDRIQSFDLASSTEFEDLAADAPRALYVWNARGYLTAGGLLGEPRKIQWAALEKPTQWTVGEGGADFQQFPDGGDVVGGFGDKFGAYVFQRGAIRAQEFAPNTGLTFRFSDANNSRGVMAPRSIVFRASNDFFYVSEEGFFRGIEGQPIGAERVDRFMLDNLSTNGFQDIQGALDPTTTMVWWLIPRSNGTKFMLGYDWQLDRWTYAQGGFDQMNQLVTPGFTLDELDAFGSLDDLPASLDSRIWKGGRPTLGAFDDSNILGFMSGPNRQATLRTNALELQPGKRAKVTELRPITDAPGTGVTARVGTKEVHGGDTSWRNKATMGRSGFIPAFADGRLHEFETCIAAGTVWSHIDAVDVTAASTGRL